MSTPIKYPATMGSTIQKSCHEALYLAQANNQEVELIHNDIRILVDPKSNYNDLLVIWDYAQTVARLKRELEELSH